MAEHVIALHEIDKELSLDGLTGLSTRQVFDRELTRQLAIIRGDETEQRKGIEPVQQLSLIAIDLDHFKDVNDAFGHAAGDEVLRSVSALLTKAVREGTDIVVRMGGEELMVLMPDADVEAAERKAEQLRAKIEKMTFEKYPELNEKVTASFGVVSSASSTDPETLYKLADGALYRSKNSGRNRIEVDRDIRAGEEIVL